MSTSASVVPADRTQTHRHTVTTKQASSSAAAAAVAALVNSPAASHIPHGFFYLSWFYRSAFIKPVPSIHQHSVRFSRSFFCLQFQILTATLSLSDYVIISNRNIWPTLKLLFLSSNRQHLFSDECLQDKREDDQNCSVLCCVLQLYTIIITAQWAVLTAVLELLVNA